MAAPTQGPLLQVRGRGARPREQRRWGRGTRFRCLCPTGGEEERLTLHELQKDSICSAASEQPRAGRLVGYGGRLQEITPSSPTGHTPCTPLVEASTFSLTTCTLPTGSPEKESPQRFVRARRMQGWGGGGVLKRR